MLATPSSRARGTKAGHRCSAARDSTWNQRPARLALDSARERAADANKAHNLAEALRTRELIGQAQGILIEHVNQYAPPIDTDRRGVHRGCSGEGARTGAVRRHSGLTMRRG